MKLKQQLAEIQQSLNKIECIFFGRRDPESFARQAMQNSQNGSITRHLNAGLTRRRTKPNQTRQNLYVSADRELADRIAIISVKLGISRSLLIETLLKRCIDAIDTQPDIIAATQEIERRLKNLT